MTEDFIDQFVALNIDVNEVEINDFFDADKLGYGRLCGQRFVEPVIASENEEGRTMIIILYMLKFSNPCTPLKTRIIMFDKCLNWFLFQ